MPHTPSTSAVQRFKAEIREAIWRIMEERGVAVFPRPVYGRIPNFVGAGEAAARLIQLPHIQRAATIKVNPDSPQQWVRRLLLRRGKTIIMPTPRLRGGFLILDPSRIPPPSLEAAATIRGAFIHGRRVGIDEMPTIDFIVEGSVAVNLSGGRLGKGEGYAEIEYGLLRELGLVEEDTPIATTVHDLQLVGEFPLEPFDVPVDFIATPTRLIETRTRHARPTGILWALLDERRLRETPLLSQLWGRRKGAGLSPVNRHREG